MYDAQEFGAGQVGEPGPGLDGARVLADFDACLAAMPLDELAEVVGELQVGLNILGALQAAAVRSHHHHKLLHEHGWQLHGNPEDPATLHFARPDGTTVTTSPQPAGPQLVGLANRIARRRRRPTGPA